MVPNTVPLLTNAVATGQTVYFPGGLADLEVVATTWGGATVSLSKLGPDNATYLPVASASLTANGIVNGLNLPAGCYKAVVAGGPPAGVFASLNAVQN